LGNCDVIIKEICLRLAKSEPIFGDIKNLKDQNYDLLKEILYENLRSSIDQQKAKKQKISLENDHPSTLEVPQQRLSSLRPRLLKSPPIVSSAKNRTFSSLKNSPLFNQDLSYISYSPRRYLFAGAEMSFSDDDESSDEEELPRKHNE
jgi:hypothetical protein